MNCAYCQIPGQGSICDSCRRLIENYLDENPPDLTAEDIKTDNAERYKSVRD